MRQQRLGQTLFSEFLTRIIEGFCYAIRVEQEYVSWEQRPFLYRAIQFFEKPQNCTRRIEPFERSILPEQKGGHVSAIRIAQAPLSIVVFGEEQSGVRAVGRILVKDPVRRSQEALGLS